MSLVLVVDDEESIRQVLSDIFEDEGYEVLRAEDGFAAMALLKTHPVDLVLLDVWLPNKGGIDVLREIKAEYLAVQVVIISGHGNIDLAVKAVKLGAYDFIEKPLSLDRVLTVAKNALEVEQLKRENRTLKDAVLKNDEMIGQSAPMLQVLELINQSAGGDTRMLILGENGTGKELVAREIHRRSARSGGPFVEVNCAAIPDTLIESELFGHEKGAFTSAVSRRTGKFEAADGGTLFLDEVADMTLSAQAKVLRVVQEMTFERVGGEKSLHVDVRIISATNKDIQAEIRAGRFREDLFFRLNVIPIQVPPLRERREDIPRLAEHFLRSFARPGATVAKGFTPEAMEELVNYRWPGNVRELKNFVERITIMSDEDAIGTESVRRFLGEIHAAEAEDTVLSEFEDMGLSEARESFEKRYIEGKLAEHGNNISRTAEALGVYPSNLHGKIRKYGIKVEK